MHWSENKITIRSSKTEHHEGGESRIVPLFAELREPLQEVFELAKPGSEPVITRYRNSTQNLRTQFIRIIQRDGVEVLPKLYQNLRATRQTELADQYSFHVVCVWMGNSRIVAQKHYLKVTEEHFESATKETDQEAANETSHIASQQTTEMARK